MRPNITQTSEYHINLNDAYPGSPLFDPECFCNSIERANLYIWSYQFDGGPPLTIGFPIPNNFAQATFQRRVQSRFWTRVPVSERHPSGYVPAIATLVSWPWRSHAGFVAETVYGGKVA